MHTRIRFAVAALMLAVGSITNTAAAQQPVVVIPPLTGHIVSPGGLPIDGAEVKVKDIGKPTRSDTQGAFTIADVPKGQFTISVRRVGYLPATYIVDWPEEKDSLKIEMLPSRTELDTVKVTAQLKVLGGVVVNERNNPIAGASVDLLGARNRTVTTGPDGWFTFTNVKIGPVVFRVLADGFEGKTQSATLTDSRGVVVHLSAIDMTLSKRKQQIAAGDGNTAKYVWAETQSRLIQRNMQATIVTSDDLAGFKDMTLGEAIQQTHVATKLAPDLQAGFAQVCVLLNGSRMVGMTSLDVYNTDDVEWVELYPPGSEASGTVGRYLQFAGCTTQRAATTTRRGVFYAVVWLKN
jgi:hypothetical protein